MSFPADTSLAEPLAVAYSRRILVIDDSALIREAAKIALGTIEGWGVVTAVSGEEGIELALSERFDAILLDVVMPGMDGVAVAERLHAIPAAGSPPVILLTAHDSLRDSESFQNAPVVGVIEKPFDISGLSREMAALLGWPV